jgi:hypothetical protein
MLHIDVAVDIRDVGRVLGWRFLVHRGYDVMLSLRDEDAMFRTRLAMNLKPLLSATATVLSRKRKSVRI